MSFWVYLEDRTSDPWCSYGKGVKDACLSPCYPPVSVESHTEGATYALGGSQEAELNVTYNYSKFYYEHLDKEEGLRWLNGKKAKECIGRLADAVGALGTARSAGYWEATEGNSGAALETMLEWAKQHPEAVFRVS